MILASAILGGLRAATAGLSFALGMALFQVFGLGTATDALLMAQVIPIVFGRQLWMLLVHAFLPCLMATGSRAEADRCFLSLSVRVGAALAILSLILHRTAPLWVGLMAPGFDGGTQALCTDILRALAPCLALLGGCGMMAGLLVSRKHFLAQESSRVLWRCGAIAALFATGTPPDPLAYARVLTLLTAAQACLLALVLLRQGLVPDKGFHPPGPAGGHVAKGLLVGSVGLGLALLTEMLDRAFLSLLPEGSVSLYGYANRLATVVPELILGTVLLHIAPDFARALHGSKATRGVSRFHSHFTFQLGLILALFLYSLVPLLVPALRDFARLDPEATEEFRRTLGILMLALPALFAQRAMGAGLQFQRNLRGMALVGLSLLLLRLPLLWFLQPHGAAGVAAAGVIALWLTLLGLWAWDRRGETTGLPGVNRHFPWLLAAAVAAAWLPPWSKWLPHPLANGLAKTLLFGFLFLGQLLLSLPRLRRFHASLEPAGTSP
jgi:peptidoglycan biosynthesis protein MviN/MurJ (putative lipid II flippase)